jgi:metal-responsive CopG/Arc/MetJ family transcriptional regulator
MRSIIVRFPDPLLNEVDELTADLLQSRSAFIRRAVSREAAFYKAAKSYTNASDF